MRKGLVFVAIVDPAQLDPYWGRGINSNRSIIDRHVDSILEQLLIDERRYDAFNRCQASAPMELLQI